MIRADARRITQEICAPALLSQDRSRGLERLLIGFAAANRECAQAREQPRQRTLEQLGLCHVANVPVRGDPDEECIERALVVRGDDRGATGGNVLAA